MRTQPDDADVLPATQDTETLPLFAPTAAETRREAYAAAQGVAQLNRDKLLAVFTSAGAMTADAAGQRCGLTPLECRPRVCELVKTGRLRATRLRAPSAAGNPATVWEAV